MSDGLVTLSEQDLEKLSRGEMMEKTTMDGCTTINLKLVVPVGVSHSRVMQLAREKGFKGKGPRPSELPDHTNAVDVGAPSGASYEEQAVGVGPGPAHTQGTASPSSPPRVAPTTSDAAPGTPPTAPSADTPPTQPPGEDDNGAAGRLW